MALSWYFLLPSLFANPFDHSPIAYANSNERNEMLTRLIAALAVLFLLLVAADPDQYAVFGWTVGLFLIFSAAFIARIHNGAAGSLAAIGIVTFGISMVGAEHYQQIRIAALCVAGAGLILITSRLAGRRRNARSGQEHRQRRQEV